MKKINKTLSISELMSSTVFGQKAQEGFETVVKHSTIFSFWGEIVGKKFEKYTKPYAIKNSKIYVSTKSPALIQELTLFKTKILEKIKTYSSPLEIEIKDIVFNYKNFDELTKQEDTSQVEDKPIYLKQEDFKEVKINEENFEEIKKSISKLNFLDENQKEKFIQKVRENEKVKTLNKNSKTTRQ